MVGEEFRRMWAAMYSMAVHGLAAFGIFCLYWYLYDPIKLCAMSVNHTLLPFWR